MVKEYNLRNKPVAPQLSGMRPSPLFDKSYVITLNVNTEALKSRLLKTM